VEQDIRIPGKEGHRWTWKKGKRNRKRRGRKEKRGAFFRGRGQWIILFGMIDFSGFWTRFFQNGQKVGQRNYKQGPVRGDGGKMNKNNPREYHNKISDTPR
jgi:hypothetical protein